MTKKIFGPYSDGFFEVYADPLVVYRRIVEALEGDHQTVLEHAKSDIEIVRLKAEGQLALASRQAFELAPFDRATGHGVIDDDAVDLLYRFLVWMTDLKNESGPKPT